MNRCNMFIHATNLRTTVDTNVTLEYRSLLDWLLSFMNWFNMSIQTALLRTDKFTHVTFEWLFSSMNRFNMFIHVTLKGKAVVTNVTFKWLLFSMNRCNMPIHVTLLRRGVFTNVTFEWLLLHELIQYVYSCYPFQKSCSCKYHIWMP